MEENKIAEFHKTLNIWHTEKNKLRKQGIPTREINQHPIIQNLQQQLKQSPPLTSDEKELVKEYNRKQRERRKLFKDMVPSFTKEETEFWNIHKIVHALQKQIKIEPRPLSPEEEKLMAAYHHADKQRQPFYEQRVVARRKYDQAVKHFNLQITVEEDKASDRSNWLPDEEDDDDDNTSCDE